MIDQLFGNYLVNKSLLSANDLDRIQAEKKQVRVKLGLIAVAEKMMTEEQADEVNCLQAVMDKRFGDLAVSKGYLTDDQVAKLLKLQGNPYLAFVQAATDLGIMDLGAVEANLEEFRKENGFNNSELEALKSGDIDRIIPLFLPADVDDLHRELIGVAVRTIIRLVDSEICLDKAAYMDSYKADGIAMQSLYGDRKATLGLGGNGGNLLAIAVPFGKEEFPEVDLDALDAVAELANCINGLFASSISSKVNMDMLPPSYQNGGVEVKGGKILALPLSIKGKTVDLLTTFDDILEFKED